jgi:alpha-ketoglutarate-dependent taurine dioxygenase
MPSGQLSGIKRFLLWDYPRASWQYDVMVAIILAFIFFTPRNIFRDQPRASDIVRLPEEHGASVFWVEPDLLASVPEPDRGSKVQQLLRSRYAKRETVIRVEPIFGDERELKGYMAFTRP